MLLKTVVSENLPGWQPAYAYFMEISHGLMGFFPAITSESHKIVVCLDRSDLEKIWTQLPIRNVKVNKELFHINMAKKLVIPMNSPRQGDADSEDFFLIAKGDLPGYLAKQYFFAWAEGLLNLHDCSDAHFPKE